MGKGGVAMFELLMALGLASAVVNIVLSMLIVGELQKRDVRINFFLIRLLIPTDCQTSSCARRTAPSLSEESPGSGDQIAGLCSGGC